MEPADLEDRFRGALVGAAVGDALGAPVEGDADPAPYLASLSASVPELRFTDDTAMTIGVAESLLVCDGFDGRHMADAFARRYFAEPWRGYGAGPPEVFDRLQKGVPWNEAATTLFGGAGSYGNGGAMRVAPVALFAHGDRSRIVELARLQAAITHTHAEGIDGAVAQALAVEQALQVRERFDTAAFIDGIAGDLRSGAVRDRIASLRGLDVGDFPRIGRRLGSGVAARSSVPAALAAFAAHSSSFADTVLGAISLGGDTDTVASMAGAISGALHGWGSIPDPWRDVEGADLLSELATRLYARVRR